MSSAVGGMHCAVRGVAVGAPLTRQQQGLGRRQLADHVAAQPVWCRGRRAGSAWHSVCPACRWATQCFFALRTATQKEAYMLTRSMHCTCTTQHARHSRTQRVRHAGGGTHRTGALEKQACMALMQRSIIYIGSQRAQDSGRANTEKQDKSCAARWPAVEYRC